MREKITLVCQECKRKNYAITKNKKLHNEKMELKKFCPFDRRHTLHKESK